MDLGVKWCISQELSPATESDSEWMKNMLLWGKLRDHDDYKWWWRWTDRCISKSKKKGAWKWICIRNSWMNSRIERTALPTWTAWFLYIIDFFPYLRKLRKELFLAREKRQQWLAISLILVCAFVRNKINLLIFFKTQKKHLTVL